MMGCFEVEFEVANEDDLSAARHGTIPEGKVRRVKIHGRVDTGATRLVLPAKVVRELGLPDGGTTRVRYADDRQATRQLADLAHVELLGRSSTFKALVEPRRRKALIGAIVLEDLDLIVNGTTQQLEPRDPKEILTEAE